MSSCQCQRASATVRMDRPDIRVIAPAQLPIGSRFALHGGDEDSRAKITRILLEACPGAVNVENIGPTALCPDFVISLDVTSNTLTGRLPVNFYDVPVLIMPLPISYVYGYYDFVDACWEGVGRIVNLTVQDRIPILRKIRYLKDIVSDWHALAATPHIGGYYWLPEWRPVPASEQDQKMMTRVRENLADPTSRYVYDMLLETNPDRLWMWFANTFLTDQDYLAWSGLHPGATVLNVGVNTGHELASFCALMAGQGQIHNFDPEGHDLLSPQARQALEVLGGGIEVRKAVSDTSGTLDLGTTDYGQFVSGREALAHSPKRVTYPCISLDDYVLDNQLPRVDFIKVDVEGGEPQVVVGMHKTIVHFRPIIAIAIYHQPQDLWRIGAAILDVVPDYQLKIGHYSPFRLETVLYAIPSERDPRPPLLGLGSR